MDKKIKYLFVGPGIIWIVVFTVFPLLYSLRLTFTDAYLNRPGNFVGIDNFLLAFNDYRWWNAFSVTIGFVTTTVFLTVILGLLLAWLFNRPVRGQKFFRAIFTMPLFVAPVALGYLGLIIFNEESGPINSFLHLFGFANIPWFTNPASARIAIILADVWQWTPFCFIVFLSAMQDISDELYDAAKLDTTSDWDLFRHITLPTIAPVIGTIAMLRMVEALLLFALPLLGTSFYLRLSYPLKTLRQ